MTAPEACLSTAPGSLVTICISHRTSGDLIFIVCLDEPRPLRNGALTTPSRGYDAGPDPMRPRRIDDWPALVILAAVADDLVDLWVRGAAVEANGTLPNIPPRANRVWKNCFSPVLYRTRALCYIRAEFDPPERVGLRSG
jgi:hypothetical protein